MSNINGKSVKTAVLLSGGLFVQGFGTTRSTLSNVDDGINKAVKMTVDEPFLLLEMKDSQTKAVTKLAVPLSNFSHMIYNE